MKTLKKFQKKSHNAKKLKGFGIFQHFCRITSKELIAGEPFEIIKVFRKRSHNAEKTERGILWDFSTSILSENINKMEGDLLLKNVFRKNSHNAENTRRVDPLVSFCILCCAEKRNNSFGQVQLVQFDT